MIRRLWPLLALALLAAAPPPGTLDRFADALAARLQPALGPPRDVDVAVAITAPWPRLASDLTALLLARLRAAGVRSAAAGGGDAAWARAAGFERVVRLELDVSGGRLRAGGNVLAIATSPWSDTVEARAHVYAETPLDAELRAYLPAASTPPGRWQARGVPVGDVDVLALDVGDLDGDGRAEVVGATRAEAVVWGWDGARLVERRRVSLAGRPAPERPRDDVATVAVEHGGFVAHASPFADGVRVTGARAAPAQGYGFPGLDTVCALQPGVDWFAAVGCAPAAGLPERFWATAGLRGGARAARAAIDAAGTLWVQLGGAAAAPAAPWSVRGVGAQLALGALDRGELVATSEPAQPGEPDAVVVRALQAGLPVVYRLAPLPGNVRALAAGDVDGDGRVEFVAAVRDHAARRTELWLVN